MCSGGRVVRWGGGVAKMLEVEVQRGEENSEAERTDPLGTCRLPLT